MGHAENGLRRSATPEMVARDGIEPNYSSFVYRISAWLKR